jgi:hypothetical protein
LGVSPIDSLGWLATAVFVGSYFFSRAETLRRVQMLGAVIWIVYGALIAAPPVIVANVLVLGAAAWTMLRAWRSRPDTSSSDGSALGERA